MSHHVLVNEPFRLVLFTIPKVGCTPLIQLMRRLDGSTDWRDPPHYKPRRPFLKELGLARVNEVLQDPSWTKAVVLRDPAERLLSAYLDKFVYEWSYASDVFRPSGHGMQFDEFLGYVLDPNRDLHLPTGLHQGSDPHWRPQRLVGSLEQAQSTIDSVGDFAEIGRWIEDVLQGVGAWDLYGATGWGANDDLAIFETNTAPNPTNAAERMYEFYDGGTLRAVYDAYIGDIRFASLAGLDLVKHTELLD